VNINSLDPRLRGGDGSPVGEQNLNRKVAQ